MSEVVIGTNIFGQGLAIGFACPGWSTRAGAPALALPPWCSGPGSVLILYYKRQAVAPALVHQGRRARAGAPALVLPPWCSGFVMILHYRSQAVAPAAPVQQGWSTGECRFYVGRPNKVVIDNEKEHRTETILRRASKQGGHRQRKRSTDK